jgi:tRNA nucleotidyltransferase/poly(A) polymerase
MFKFYEVGGKVRDELLGLQSKDIDYVAVPKDTEGYSTDIIFEDLKIFLEKEGYQIFLSTPDCYTIRALFPKNHKFAGIVTDFVLARKEIGYKEGTREPIVVPGTLYDDLARRDFTVNAIAKDPETGIYIDPFNGMKDIDLRVLKTPIEGKITFEDDPLRLLRAIRFAITKGFYIGNEIEYIIERFDYNKKFGVISEERIREELYKCFKHNTLDTLKYLEKFYRLKQYIFTKTKLWLKPTNEQ